MGRTRIRRWLVWTLVLLAVWTTLAPWAVLAEPAKLKLSVQKVKGADLLGRVTGVFRVAVRPPENVRLVLFYVDGQAVAYATSSPFSFQLDTKDFAKGEHRIEAVAHLSNGTIKTSNTVRLSFRPENWWILIRQSMYLYAVLVLLLGIAGGWAVSKLLRMQPRLTLLDR